MLKSAIGTSLAVTLSIGMACAQQPRRIVHLTAETLRIYIAPEAHQGAAVDADFFYAVGNTVIARYRRADGTRSGRWQGAADGLITHLNSCYAAGSELHCASSNFPETPMASSVEIFDAVSLQHRQSISLGIMDEGSLTWFERVDGGYLAAFAHYDRGGISYKDHRASGLVLFDESWRRRGGWMFPDSVLERVAPFSLSGGQLGPDGLLYVLGHDKPEMYVLAKPKMGPKMIHLATISIGANGQAFSWDRSSAGRRLFGIDRQRGLVLEIRVPIVAVDNPFAEPFR